MGGKISLHSKLTSLPYRRSWGFVTRPSPWPAGLRNYDGDGNGNVKKAIRVNEQNNIFARASRFFAHFFAISAQLRREMAVFYVNLSTGMARL